MNYKIKIELSPELDVAKFNAILATFKSSLGKFGADISPINVDKFKSDMKQFGDTAKTGFDSIKDSIDDAGDSTDAVLPKASGLGKAFEFNQAVESLRNMSDALGSITADYIKFDEGTAKIRTLGGAAKENADAFAQMSLEMSRDIPISADVLQTATYEALSAGINATKEDISAFMGSAAKLAVGGGETIGNTVNLLSSMVNAYGESAAKTGEYSDVLFTTVNLGKTNIAELSATLSNVIPTAAAYGYSLKNVGASLALMTANGIPTAQATTKLNQLMLEMQKPGTELAKILSNAGISAESLGKKVKSGDVVGALKDMDGAFKQAGVSATQAFSSAESGAAFNVLSKDFDKLQTTMDGFNSSAGATQAAYEEMSGTVAGRSAQLKAMVSGMFIEFNKLFGQGFALAVSGAQQILPLITTVNGLRQAQEYLTITKIKTAAIDTALSAKAKALAAMQLIQAGATKVATLAQSGLNVAMLANPIGLIVLGVAALVGAMYLLYKNVEPVREIFDATFSAINAAVQATVKFVGDLIDYLSIGIKAYVAMFVAQFTAVYDVINKLINFDISGAIDVMTNSASNAADAVSGAIEQGLNEKNWDEAAKNMSESLGKGAEIKLKINTQEALSGYVTAYEESQKAIESLQAQKKAGNLTEEQKKELEGLEATAKKAAIEIAKIAPEAKANTKLVVDASGKLVEQFDINVKKAKKLSSTDISSKNLTGAAEEYSKALNEQAGIIDKQKGGLQELKKQIDSTNDPTVKQRLIDKYNEELAAIDKNKQELVKSFLEGGKAGLVTENAIARVTTQLGITTKEAEKMLLAESLKEASKSGRLTEAQIEKLAKKYNSTVGEAKKILGTQEDITNETKKTSEAAKTWSDSLSGVSKAQKEAIDAIAKANLDRQKGVITSEKYKEIETAQLKIAKDLGNEKKLQQKALNAALRVTKGIYTDDVAAQKKATVETKSQYEIRKQIFDKKNEEISLLQKQSDAEDEYARLKSGIILSEEQSRKDGLKTMRVATLEAERQLASYKAVYSAAEAQYKIEEKKGKISQKTTDSYDEAKKKLAELSTALLSAGSVEISARLKLDRDAAAIQKEVKQLSAEMELQNIEYKVRLGLLPGTELLAAQIKAKETELADQNQMLNVELGLDTEESKKKAQELRNAINLIQQELQGLKGDYAEEAMLEKIKSIEDLAVRERELSLNQARKTYAQDIVLAGENNALKEAAFAAFVNKKLEIEKQYIDKSKKLQDIALSATMAFTDAFAKAFTDNAINPIDEALTNLQKKLSDVTSPRSKADLTGIKEEEKFLFESFKRGEIGAEQFQSKLSSINEKRLNADIKRTEGTNETLLQLQLGLLSGLKAVHDKLNSSMSGTAEAFANTVKTNYEKLKKESKDGTVEIGDTLKGTTDAMTTFALQGVAMATSGFASLLAAGEDVGTALRKGLLVDMLKTAEQGLLTLIPLIWAQWYATLGPLGAVGATIAVGLISGLMNAARANIGRKDGEVNIRGRGTSTSDDNPRLLSTSESVLTARATMAEYSIPLYEWQNKTGGSPVEYFTKVNPSPFKDLIKKVINEENWSQIAPIMVSHSDHGGMKELKGEVIELRKEVARGNYMRKERTAVDVGISVDDEQLFNRIKVNKQKELKGR
jgi:TP901 family phage tail tape measure protein